MRQRKKQNKNQQRTIHPSVMMPSALSSVISSVSTDGESLVPTAMMMILLMTKEDDDTGG